METGDLSALFVVIASVFCGCVFLATVYQCGIVDDLDLEEHPDNPDDTNVRRSRAVDRNCDGFVRLVELSEVKELLLDVLRHLEGETSPSAEETTHVEEKQRHGAETDGNETSRTIYVMKTGPEEASNTNYEKISSRVHQKQMTSTDQDEITTATNDSLNP